MESGTRSVRLDVRELGRLGTLVLLKRSFGPSLKNCQGRLSTLSELSQPFALKPTQGLRIERVYLLSSSRFGMNQASVFQNSEVPGYRGATHVREPARNFTSRYSPARTKQFQDLSPRWS